MEITFIGTSNAFASGGLCWNGFIADQRILFETPPQVLMSLHHVGLDPNKVETIVLSHHHGDHFLGLPFLLLHWKYRERKKPIRIVGPVETERLAKDICTTVYPGLFEDCDFEIIWQEIRPGEMFTTDDLVLEAVGVKHDARLSQNLGFHCSIGNERFGYTGDSALCDGVLDLARANSLLISECSSRAENIPTHMNLVDDMPEVRKVMEITDNLILTHISSDVSPNNLPNTIVARDYATYRY